MRGLVISGGGSKGAFAGGIAEYLVGDCGFTYNVYVGTSTGSLMVPLIASMQMGKLKEIYTSVTQDDIFNINPFKIYEKNGELHSKINHFSTLRTFFRRSRTFGESKNLRNLIEKMFTEADFNYIMENKRKVAVTVSNLTLSRVEYKVLYECTYTDFCDWIWASANMIPFMSLLNKDGYDYADGGIGNMVPIAEAIRLGASTIDVIVLKPESLPAPKPKINNAFELTTRVYDFMFNQIILDDIAIGKLTGLSKKIDINFYHPPEMLTENALLFDPETMKGWWKRGYQYAKENNPTCRCIEV